MISKNIGTLGEFGLIDKIKKATLVDRTVLLGIGDDSAVLRTPKGRLLLLTTDMLIEGRHFRRTESTGFQVGWKAMAVNISDIAAMGGLPAHAVISVGLPRTLNIDYVKEVYRGIQTLARRFHVNVVGGDTNAADKITICVTVMGFVKQNELVKRSGAQIGDVIFVSGSLGGSYASMKHLNFMPRIVESQFLVKHFNIHAMMDISDGLASDIYRLTRASGVGAIISKEAVPVSASAKNTEQAMNDGEDFELLFTLSPKEAARLTLSESARKFTPFYPVGKIVEKKYGVRIACANQETQVLREKGFDHFRD